MFLRQTEVAPPDQRFYPPDHLQFFEARRAGASKLVDIGRHITQLAGDFASALPILPAPIACVPALAGGDFLAKTVAGDL